MAKEIIVSFSVDVDTVAGRPYDPLVLAKTSY